MFEMMLRAWQHGSTAAQSTDLISTGLYNVMWLPRPKQNKNKKPRPGGVSGVPEGKHV